MGGVNLLYQGAGWLEGGLTASYEKLIIDAEILQMMAEVLQPLEVSEASLGLDAIAEAGPGRAFLRDGAHAGALRDLRSTRRWSRLAQLRDVGSGWVADGDAAGEHHLEAAACGRRPATARLRHHRGTRRVHRATEAPDR
jgi:trimethylamine:corrinoid methyltransferase-like protein